MQSVTETQTSRETATLVCAHSTDCVKYLDREGRVLSFNADGLRIMEIEDLSSVLGVYWPDLWPVPDRKVVERALTTARAHELATFVAPCPTAKGTMKWWDVTVISLQGPAISYIAISRDITEQRTAHEAEHNAFDRLDRIARSNADVLWDIDLAANRVWWSEGIHALFGYGIEEVSDTTEWCHDHIHPEDRQRVIQSMTNAVESGAVNWEEEFRYRKADGEYLSVLDRGAIIRAPDGKAVRFVGVMQDVTARTAAITTEKLVAAELSHRVNNILGVVTGLFQQSLRYSSNRDELAQSFGSRLIAMANANTAIVRGSGSAAPMIALAESQLEPFIQSGRIKIDGPEVELPAEIAQPVALALNELATNALKYGALGGDRGQVTISWDVERNGARDVLNFQWAESGGPPVKSPTRSGMGSKLIG